jgi:hypothetical protein
MKTPPAVTLHEDMLLRSGVTFVAPPLLVTAWQDRELLRTTEAFASQYAFVPYPQLAKYSHNYLAIRGQVHHAKKIIKQHSVAGSNVELWERYYELLHGSS